MSNKRIDLTLYEGHTKGDPNDNPDSWRVVGDGFVMNGTSPQPRYIGYIRHSNFEPDIPATHEPLSTADANLVADGPLLLAELKRHYDAIDDLTWRHMQVLRERKDLRDSVLSMAKKADFQRNRIESLIDALRIIRDDLDEAIAQGHLPIKSADGIDVTKIRNFANDATQ